MNPIVLISFLLLGSVPLLIGYFLGYDVPAVSPVYLTSTVLYFVCASVATFDTRLIQSRWSGIDLGELPAWTGLFGWLQWAIFCVLAILNWKVAIILFVLKFVLKVIPVLETVGALIMIPFTKKRDKNGDASL